MKDKKKKQLNPGVGYPPLARPLPPAPAAPPRPSEPTETQPEIKGVLSLFSAVHCAECQRALIPGFSSKGKLQLHHDRSDCIHTGKHFEPPTVMLRELP